MLLLSLTISCALALLSLSAFSKRLVISLSLTASSSTFLSEVAHLMFNSLMVTWLDSNCLTMISISCASLFFCDSMALSLDRRSSCLSWMSASWTVYFFLSPSTSSILSRASMSYFFFQSADSSFRVTISFSMLIRTSLYSSISMCRVLTDCSRVLTLFSAVALALLRASMFSWNSFSWAANLFLSKPAASIECFSSFILLTVSELSCWSRVFSEDTCRICLFISWILTLYSLMLISSFSTIFFMESFSLDRTSMWASSSEISVCILDFCLTMVSLDRETDSICSWSSIMASWCFFFRVRMVVSDSMWESSNSFLSLAISASRLRLMSSWDSAPPSASVSLSDREMIWTCSPCFSFSILRLRLCSLSRSSWMILILSSRRLMEAEEASEEESMWVTTSLETFPDESVVYWTVLVVFLDDMAE